MSSRARVAINTAAVLPRGGSIVKGCSRHCCVCLQILTYSLLASVVPLFFGLCLPHTRNDTSYNEEKLSRTSIADLLHVCLIL